jgi:hypothetical protein
MVDLNNRTENILDEHSTLYYENDKDEAGVLVVSDEGIKELEKYRDELVTQASRIHKIVSLQKKKTEKPAIYTGGDCAS